jgi:tetratricopeptide (TPR) repeat protein
MREILGFGLFALMALTACGINPPTSQIADGNHAGHNAPAAPADLQAIKSLHDEALLTGTTAAIDLQLSQVMTLGRVPLIQLKKDVGLAPGFGQEFLTYLPISGASLNAEQLLANQLVNQGIAMFHNFHYIDAVRSFEQALRVVPTNIEAKIFLSLAYISFGGELNAYLFAAKQLADLELMSLSPNQKAWLQFARTYVFEGGNAMRMQKAFSNLLSTTKGQDFEAITIGGWVSNLGNRTMYENVIKADPNHIGAVHYVLHLLEFENKFQEAISFGKKLAELSPSGAHAQHMYGHLLPMNGDLDGALAQFLKAEKIHLDWAAKYGYDLNYDWHVSHNNHLMGIVYLAKGNIQDATRVLYAGCEADMRACEALGKLAVMELDPKLTKLAIKGASVMAGPGSTVAVAAHFSKYDTEIDFLTGATNDPQAIYNLGTSTQDPVLQIAAVLSTLTPNSVAEIAQIKGFVDSLFQGGGFDSWASGFPNARRVRLAAQKYQLQEIVDHIDLVLAKIVTP